VTRVNAAVMTSLVAILVVILVLSGLPFSVPAAAAPAANPRQAPPSTLRIGNLQEPSSMNPFVGVLVADYSVYASVYDLLVGIGEDLTPVPQLASNWSVSADGLTWTFNLFNGVVWHDDTTTIPRPFTSADVKFTFEYIQNCQLSLFLNYVGDPTDPNAAYINQITTPTPTQVVIRTNKPKANMLSLFVPILPQHIWTAVGCQQAKGQGYKNEPPIGTGMYKFVSWQKGQFLRLQLNTAYHFLQPAKDYVDEIVYRFYNSASSLYNDFLAGNLDTTSALAPRQFLSLPADIDGGTANPDADPDPDISKFVQDSISLAEMGFCSADDALLTEFGGTGERHWLSLNVTIRRAVANAMNKSRIIDTIWSGTDVASGQNLALAKAGSTLIPPATPFWSYNVTAQEDLVFDVALAAARLSDPRGDGYTTTDANPPNLLGSNLDPTAPNNRDAFGDMDADGIRDILDLAYVASQHPGVAPQANRAVRNSAITKLLFGLWIISTDIEGIDAADLFIPALNSIGIGVEKKIVSSAQQLAISYECDYDWYIWGWGFDVDPDFGLSVMTKDQILGWQDAWYYNAAYDAWYLEQQQKVDLYERQTIVHAMQRLLYGEQPYNILWYPKTTTVVRSDRFTNWGDWAAHPGLGLTGFGNVFTMLTLEPLVGAANQCPTNVQIGAPATPPRVVFVGEIAGFLGTAFDAESNALNWTWDWKDGSTTQVDTPAGDISVTVTHTWTNAGDFNITLSVTDNLCGATTLSAPVWVRVVPAPTVIGWIVGTVTDSVTGLPVPNATVTASPAGRSNVTAADGTYNLSLAPGTYTVTVSKQFYVSASPSVTVTQDVETRQDFQISPNRGWIYGRVTDATTGAALEGVAMRVDDGSGGQYPDIANATGEYNITVPPGTYTVHVVQAEGYVTQNRTGVTVSNDQAVQENFQLQPVPRPGLSTAAIVAIGVTIAIIIAAIAALLVRRRKKSELPPAGGTAPPGSLPPPPPPPER